MEAFWSVLEALGGVLEALEGVLKASWMRLGDQHEPRCQKIKKVEKTLKKQRKMKDFGQRKRALKGGGGSGRGAWSNPSFGRIFEEESTFTPF